LTTPVVVDANILGKVLLQEPDAAMATRFLSQTADRLIAPAILHDELLGLCLKAIRMGRFSSDTASSLYLAVIGLPIPLSNEPFSRDDFETAPRHRLTLNDMRYVGLASRLNAPLVTDDRQLRELAAPLVSTLSLSEATQP